MPISTQMNVFFNAKSADLWFCEEYASKLIDGVRLDVGVDLSSVFVPDGLLE